MHVHPLVGRPLLGGCGTPRLTAGAARGGKQAMDARHLP